MYLRATFNRGSLSIDALQADLSISRRQDYRRSRSMLQIRPFRQIR
jgi:hypothetical protein